MVKCFVFLKLPSFLCIASTALKGPSTRADCNATCSNNKIQAHKNPCIWTVHSGINFYLHSYWNFFVRKKRITVNFEPNGWMHIKDVRQMFTLSVPVTLSACGAHGSINSLHLCMCTMYYFMILLGIGPNSGYPVGGKFCWVPGPKVQWKKVSPTRLNPGGVVRGPAQGQ